MPEVEPTVQRAERQVGATCPYMSRRLLVPVGYLAAMPSTLQAALVLAAVAGAVLAMQRKAVHDRWWVTLLIGLIGFSINGFVVPLGGLFLLVPALAQPRRSGGSVRP